jgi:pyruvate dehydrogenase E2 component (dihydrolipoamide acetyltransferase)
MRRAGWTWGLAEPGRGKFMSTDIVMPQMGESIFEGTITKWLKKPGDRVERDEPLFEISTDKVDAEIPSPTAGVLSEIKVQEGATVGINTVVAVVSEGSEAQLSAAPAVSSTASAAGASTPAADGTSSEAPATSGTAARPTAGGVEVVMPQMGESIFEGTITRWHKQAGDSVQKDEPLFEISTDKVDAEIPAPAAGVLSEIKVPEGSTVQINTVVAVIRSAAALLATGPGSTQDLKPQATPPAREASGQMAAADPSFADKAAEAVLLVARTDASQRLRSSPLVRRMAREHRLDLESIAGSGSGGRITKEDVLLHMSRQPSAAEAADTTQRSPESASPLPGNLAPLSRMRSIIADRMAESRAASPHAYLVYKIDMTRIARLRERERAGFEQRHRIKLTWMPFIATAVIEALRRHPILNASLVTGEDKTRSIQYHSHIQLGLAVALEWGLIVPVIRQSETLGFVALARSMADLAERARGKKLQPDEASGSTFTLTNAGVFGGEFGTPIINQPEAAILAIGGLKKEAVVLTDAEGGDTIAIRSMQSYCLGFDHRLIDGADAGRFMTVFQQVLEGWDRPIG